MPPARRSSETRTRRRARRGPGAPACNHHADHTPRFSTGTSSGCDPRRSQRPGSAVAALDASWADIAPRGADDADDRPGRPIRELAFCVHSASPPSTDSLEVVAPWKSGDLCKAGVIASVMGPPFRRRQVVPCCRRATAEMAGVSTRPMRVLPRTGCGESGRLRSPDTVGDDGISGPRSEADVSQCPGATAPTLWGAVGPDAARPAASSKNSTARAMAAISATIRPTVELFDPR
jgi:hypothetical protein